MKTTPFINLASQPFRRERARNVGLAIASAVLFCTLLILVGLVIGERARAASVRHLMERDTARLQALQQEQSRYSAVLSRPGNANIFARNVFLNELIARRAVSWTVVFRDLEQLLPSNMRLVGIRLPQVASEEVNGTNRVQLDMILASDRPDTIIELLRRLEKSDLFGDAQMINQQPPTQNEPSFRYRVTVAYGQKL